MVEVPAMIDENGVHIQDVTPLPAKIMLNHVYPEWLDMERDLYAFLSGDKTMLLWQLLNEHGTKNYDLAVTLLDELIQHPDVHAVEEFEKFTPEEYIATFFKYQKPLVS